MASTMRSVTTRVTDTVRPLWREVRLATGTYPKLVPETDLRRYFAMAALDQAARVDGPLTYFEAGVFTGQSMSIWHATVTGFGLETRIFGADSFEGLPTTVESDVGDWSAGDFTCPLPVTRRNLRRHGVPVDEVRLIEGWFDETLTPELGAEVGTVHVAMLDADAYSSTVPVLTFLTDLLDDVAWVVFDDWFTGGNFDPTTGRSRGVGVEQAFREWHAANPQWQVEERGTYDLTHSGETFRAGRIVRLSRDR